MRAASRHRRRRARGASGGDAAAARRLLDDALGLWRGPALADVAFESFAQGEIARLEELRLAALEERVDARLSSGEHALVVAELEQLAADHPSRERLVGLLMLALYRCGRQTDALETYTQSRRRLDEELGLEPSSHLRRLQEAILRQDPTLDAASVSRTRGQPRVAAPSLPAQLRPRPAMPFVGRAAELDRLVALPEQARTDGRQLALVGGEPGSGRRGWRGSSPSTSPPAGCMCSTAPATRRSHALPAACRGARAVPRKARADELEPSADRYPASLTRLLPGFRAGAGDRRRRLLTREEGIPMRSVTSSTSP